MPIQLDKILADIAREKFLHPNYPDATKADTDEAWDRVSKSNKLSVHEARSIFKVLQKKYEQEKQKGKSAWKLYSIMEEIHRKVELKPTIAQDEDADLPMEEDEEYEMLEVQEEDEHPGLAQATANSTGSASASDSESPTKSSHCSNGTPEKDEKPTVKPTTYGKQSNIGSSGMVASNADEKKLLNSMVSTTPVRTLQSHAAVAALHKKGITLKKANTPHSANASAPKMAVTGTNTQTKSITARVGGQVLEMGKTIQLPDNIKRKLCEDQAANTPVLKKIHISKTIPHSNSAGDTKSATPQTSNSRAATPITANTATSQLLQIKQERDDTSTVTTVGQGINLITIPANPTRAEIAQTVGTTAGPSSSTAATVASTASTNGFSPRIEEIDFRNDIIFDAGNGLNGTAPNKAHGSNAASDIINLGNFDNTLPLTFFKNLCNSRHEALGLYVANVMNRLGSRSAAKLELGILRAIIDVQSDELEQ